jgi:carboxynorspermidine decarboxylase
MNNPKARRYETLMDFQAIKNTLTSSPAFVIDEAAIIECLNTLTQLKTQSGCKLLYSVKALPLSFVLETVKPYVDGFSVSSLFEARLANEILAGSGSLHLTTPGLRADEIAELSKLCSHISFNSLSQHQRYADQIHAHTSIGLRINPKLSFLDDDRFNPCRPHSKLGVDITTVKPYLEQVQGIHLHNVFSATDVSPLIKTIDKVQQTLGDCLEKLHWINLGGGYLFNQVADLAPLIERINQLKNTFGIETYIEPGKAMVGHAGHLVSTVLDCFISDGKTIGILDTSVNHNPEVFEYQRPPECHEHDANGQHSVILAGCTCLAGDVFGEYRFNKPLNIGDKIVFKNVGAYSLIKANRFNGYNLPDIFVVKNNQPHPIKHYTYQDYRQQWLAD